MPTLLLALGSPLSGFALAPEDAHSKCRSPALSQEQAACNGPQLAQLSKGTCDQATHQGPQLPLLSVRTSLPGPWVQAPRSSGAEEGPPSSCVPVRGIRRSGGQ